MSNVSGILGITYIPSGLSSVPSGFSCLSGLCIFYTRYLRYVGSYLADTIVLKTLKFISDVLSGCGTISKTLSCE